MIKEKLGEASATRPESVKQGVFNICEIGTWRDFKMSLNQGLSIKKERC